MSEVAEYKGKTVRIIRKYHYSPNRWWVETLDGTMLPDSPFNSGSVFVWHLKDIRPLHPVDEAQMIEREIDATLRSPIISGGEILDLNPPMQNDDDEFPF
jgi:hypothetical protein